MKTICEQFTISDLESFSSSPLARHLFSIWKDETRYGRRSFESFQALSPHLLLLSPPQPDKPLSNLLFCGKETMASQMFGDDWATNSVKGHAIFCSDYSEEISKSQSKCTKDDEPIYDYVSSFADGQPLIYERLLLPIKTAESVNLFLCYSMPICVPAIAGTGSSGEHRYFSGQQRMYRTNPHPMAEMQIPAEIHKSL